MTSVEESKPYVGGQAVIEGVMMRSPRCLAVAVRRPDGSIVVREDAWISIFERLKFLRWPGLRGSVILVESLYNGIQALNFSAAHAGLDEESGAPKATPASRRVEACSRSTSSVVRVITGTARSARATAPAKPEKVWKGATRIS